MTVRAIVARTQLGASLDDYAWPAHDARASLPYSFDFGPLLDDLLKQLGSGASITLDHVDVLRSADTALTVGAASVSGGIATVRVSGGTAGTTATIGFVPTLSDGFVLDAVSIALPIVSRMDGLASVVPPANDNLTFGGAPLTFAGLDISF